MVLTVTKRKPPPLETAWAAQIPDEQWSVDREVVDQATARGLPFLLGGAFALATYTGRWRNTKDLDFFILPQHREAMVELLSNLGFEDYYDQLPYERHWIYRAIHGEIIVDVIWQMANRRTQVDESWFAEAPTVRLRGTEPRLLAPEELTWTKLYVLQHERTDWPDLFNLFYAAGPALDWERLLACLDEDAPLLGAALTVFAWLCPGRARELPAWLWERLRLPVPEPAAMVEQRRVELLDTRPWLGVGVRCSVLGSTKTGSPLTLPARTPNTQERSDMLIGAMNHPRRDVIEEIRGMADLGLDFIDLTLEPPCAASGQVDPRAIRAALDATGLGVVGHTAPYLPIASVMEGLRQAAVAELQRCLRVFGAIGVSWMNIHPDRYAPMHEREFFVQRNIQSLTELLPVSQECGVGLMIENLPGEFNSVAQLAPILEPLPEIGLHLDIGHANLQVAQCTADELIRAYGPRIRHVHLHDNKGGHADLHLPLGAGSVDVAAHLRTLKASGYDGTITLEVFSPDKHYLTYSRDLLRQWWDEGGAAAW